MLKEPPGRETEGQGADSHLLRLTTQGEAQNIPLTTIRVNRTENPPGRAADIETSSLFDDFFKNL